MLFSGDDCCGMCGKSEHDDKFSERWVLCKGKCQKWFHVKCLKVKRLPKEYGDC